MEDSTRAATPDDEQPVLFTSMEMLAFQKIKRRNRGGVVEKLFRCLTCPSEKAHRYALSKSHGKSAKVELYLCDGCAVVAWNLPLLDTVGEYTEAIRKARRGAWTLHECGRSLRSGRAGEAAGEGRLSQ
jgi:hypothetical protein